MNDKVEYRNGDSHRWNNIFFASFMAENKESIAMWSMYAQPWVDGVKIAIPMSTMKAWLKSVDEILEVSPTNYELTGNSIPINERNAIHISSVAYSNATSCDSNNNTETLMWSNKKNTKIPNCQQISELTGYIKDDAWDYEKEVRLKAEFENTFGFRRVAIKIQKENKKDKRILRFFYLLRDDIFVSKDRTKFFDYIIPIVPVVDSSNSYDQFISHFKKGGFFEKFDESFLQGLSLYIDDMRLLKNIYNEFVIYFNRLNITELDCNKMLAIIAYKNLFPRDFADLQLNQGFVCTLFNNKEQFIAEEVKRLSEKITEIGHKIELAKNEHLKTIKELDAAFEDKKPIDCWNRKQDLSAADAKDYAERKQAIETRLNNAIPDLESKKLSLEQELILIQNKPLCDIITRDNINKIFSITSTNEIGCITDFNEIKGSEYFDLLKYLIRNGYIDETYADYMTYFYENSLSRVDKIFLRSITDRKAKEYTYHLKNPALIVSRLRLVDFDQEEILNFDLLTYLLQTTSHIKYLERLIDQLRETKNSKFIGEYFDIAPEIQPYIKYLNIWWPEVFNTLLKENEFSERQIRDYSIYSIYSSDDDTIKIINQDNCLCSYISNTRDYLAIYHPNIDKLIHGFKLLGICFIGFDYETLNKDLFYAVYAESLYKITAENLRLILMEILGEKNEEMIRKSSPPRQRRTKQEGQAL